MAVRHALRRPFVQIIQKGERIPFDVAGVRTIEVDHRDLDSAEAARLEIERQMKATIENGTEVESPISVAVDLDRLRKSDNPEKRQLADLIASLFDIKLAVSSVQKTLSEPASLIPPAYVRELFWELDRERTRQREELHYVIRAFKTDVLNDETLSSTTKEKLAQALDVIGDIQGFQEYMRMGDRLRDRDDIGHGRERLRERLRGVLRGEEGLSSER